MDDLILVGANPAIGLWVDGETRAYASCWRVDWSIEGAGTAIILWREGKVEAISSRPELAEWLASNFVRHFPEFDGLAWSEVELVEQPVEIVVDLDGRSSARSSMVEVAIDGVLARRTYATDDFPLGGQRHALSLVLAPCAEGSIAVDGERLPGEVVVSGSPERPSSSAFAAEAEVWRRIRPAAPAPAAS